MQGTEPKEKQSKCTLSIAPCIATPCISALCDFWGSLLFIISDITMWIHILEMYTSMFPIKRKNLKLLYEWALHAIFILYGALYPPRTWKQDNWCCGMGWNGAWRIQKHQKQLLTWLPCWIFPSKTSLKGWCWCCHRSSVNVHACFSTLGSALLGLSQVAKKGKEGI